MLNLSHPDELKDWQDLKALKRGSRQAADEAAMDAMWEALESGKSKEEVNKIFSTTYMSFLTQNK
jgi:fructose-1,6-bisphosphatase/sedoheptulose 1,7-bisphosphatase-like protein